MPPPTKPWTPPALDETLPKGVILAKTLRRIRDNQDHVQQVDYDIATQTPTGQGHRHKGSESAAVPPPVTENWIVGPCPSDIMQGTWSRSGFTNQPGNTHLWYGDAVGSYLWQPIGPSHSQLTARPEWFGTSGMRCVASFYAKADDQVLAGAMRFGFSDGSNSVFDHFGDILPTQISTGWKRYFLRATVGANASTDCRLLLHVTASMLGVANAVVPVGVTGFQVQQGDALTMLTPSMVEAEDYNWGKWDPFPQAPVFDEQVSLRDAVDITP